MFLLKAHLCFKNSKFFFAYINAIHYHIPYYQQEHVSFQHPGQDQEASDLCKIQGRRPSSA